MSYSSTLLFVGLVSLWVEKRFGLFLELKGAIEVPSPLIVFAICGLGNKNVPSSFAGTTWGCKILTSWTTYS